MSKKELSIVFIFIVIFIFIRTVRFPEHLNFSFDQAAGASRSLEIWREREITLVGPGTSLIGADKQILQGSINYYFPLLFFLAGRWDPIISSYLFMIFGAIMILPLFWAVKTLSNKKIAIFILTLYTLLPFYIDYSRFFFGPSFQLSLLPILFFLMALYKKFKQSANLFLVFVFAGILLQFHYQALLLIVLLLVYYLPHSENRIKSLTIALTGLTLGFLPMIIFELKNHFYNLTVLAEYLKYTKKPANFFFMPYRFLIISLFLTLILTVLYKKLISWRLTIVVFLFLLILDLALYLPTPKNAFGMAPDWNYLYEKKVNQIIRGENLKNYNIVNMAYDNLSEVQKYLLRKDNININFYDYRNNRYLFIVSKTGNFMSDPAYEINTFKPSKVIRKWKINSIYDLYLLQRETNPT